MHSYLFSIIPVFYLFVENHKEVCFYHTICFSLGILLLTFLVKKTFKIFIKNEDFIKRLCIGLNQIVLDMLERNVENAGVIMHGGAMMMRLGATAVPHHKPVEWTADCGRGYSIMITPSLYHKSGIVEVYDVI